MSNQQSNTRTQNIHDSIEEKATKSLFQLSKNQQASGTFGMINNNWRLL